MLIEQGQEIAVKGLVLHPLMTLAHIYLDACSRKIDRPFLRHRKNTFHAAFMELCTYTHPIRLTRKLRARNHIFTLLASQDRRQIPIHGMCRRKPQAARHDRVEIEAAHQLRAVSNARNTCAAQHQCGTCLILTRRIRLLLVNGNPVVGIEMNHILIRRKSALKVRKQFSQNPIDTAYSFLIGMRIDGSPREKHARFFAFLAQQSLFKRHMRLS